MYQLEDALAALSIKLTPEELASLEEPYEPHPILGHS
jgi:aryl-alcohol dehydrogenase (NADP+)